MKNKILKILLVAIFLVSSGLAFIIIFNKNTDENLTLSESINKFELITFANEKFDSNYVANYPSLIFFGFL